MNRNTQKSLELEFGKAFINALNEVDPGSITHDDEPDFFVGPHKQIGIELTQIHSNTVSGDSWALVEGSRDNLKERLMATWAADELPACHVQLSFMKPILIPNLTTNRKTTERGIKKSYNKIL